MIGVLLVTHGRIGASLLESTAQILDAAPRLTATLGVSRQDAPDDLLQRARKLVKQLDEGDGVLVLTDIFGATPGNVIARILEDGRVEGVSGVSLPMLLRVLSNRDGAPDLSVRQLVQLALSGGADGVVHMNTDRCCDA